MVLFFDLFWTGIGFGLGGAPGAFFGGMVVRIWSGLSAHTYYRDHLDARGYLPFRPEHAEFGAAASKWIAVKLWLRYLWVRRDYK